MRHTITSRSSTASIPSSHDPVKTTVYFIEKSQNKCLNFLPFHMKLQKKFPLQFLLAGRIGFYNGPDLVRGSPIKNPWSKISSVRPSSPASPSDVGPGFSLTKAIINKAITMLVRVENCTIKLQKPFEIV